MPPPLLVEQTLGYFVDLGDLEAVVVAAAASRIEKATAVSDHVLRRVAFAIHQERVVTHSLRGL